MALTTSAPPVKIMCEDDGLRARLRSLRSGRERLRDSMLALKDMDRVTGASISLTTEAVPAAICL